MPALQTTPESAAGAHAVPPAERMVQLLAGFQLSQALYAVAALGIADLLRGGPKDAAVLAGGIKLGAIGSVDFTGAGHIVDVGGADGAVLAHILAAAPGTDGVAFDLPHVVAEAEPRLAGYGHGDRLKLASGDFFTAVPEGGDTYLLSMVLHDWSDEEASRLLANIKAAAPAGAPARGVRVRRSRRCRAAHGQDDRPDHARHAQRQGTHPDRVPALA